MTIGDGATIAGGTGIKDNVTIGAGATIAARAAVMDDIPAREVWAGYPAAPVKDTMRRVAAANKLPDLLKRVQELERRLGGLQAGPEQGA